VKVSVLASGSKGNSTYIEFKNTKILLDIGMSAKYIMEKLNNININPEELDAIVISHDHADHISGLKVFIKKYPTKIYGPKSLIQKIDNIEKDSIYNFFNIKDIKVETFPTSHDAEESYGFLINDELVHITDTGYINQKYHRNLTNKKIYLIESNFDTELLMEGHYPYYLKQRMNSDKGHLSNHKAAEFLSKVIGKNTKQIILCHMSENNNNDDKVYEAINKYIKNQDKIKIKIARQKENTELIEV